MRFPFTLFLICALIIGGGYWYRNTAAFCPVPLSYRLGALNESFNLEREAAIDILKAAELQWEQSVSRDLFVYEETADFTINFVFDERQELSDSERSQRDALDEQLVENEELFSIIDAAQAEYDTAASSYQDRADTYETRLEAYNQTVLQYNDRGGAPEEEFTALEEERTSLNREANALTILTDELNELAARLNALSNRGNDLVDVYNSNVERYNEQFGFSHEFTQGDYQGDKINIYEFSNENELQAVLLHELGHALGIDHIDATSSVMYYLLEDTEDAPSFSADDLAAYYDVCGAEESFEQKLRHSIRSVFNIF